MKRWEARISAGETNDGQIGLCFDLHFESEEKPTTEQILKKAKEALGEMDSYELDSNRCGSAIVLFTNPDALTDDCIGNVYELRSRTDFAKSPHPFQKLPCGK